MSKTSLVLTVALGLVFSVSTTVSAGTSAVLRAEIPFSFQVGSATLPQGEYEVTLNEKGVLRLQAVESGGVGTAITVPKTDDATLMALRHSVDWASLVFERTGERHELSEIRLGDGSAREVLGGAKRRDYEYKPEAVSIDLVN